MRRPIRQSGSPKRCAVELSIMLRELFVRLEISGKKGIFEHGLNVLISAAQKRKKEARAGKNM